MAFVVPTFNMECAWWQEQRRTDEEPDLVFMGQLRGPSHTSLTMRVGYYDGNGPVLLCAKGTEIRENLTTPNDPCIIEAPYRSGRFYFCTYVDDIAKGFTNEHRYAILIKAPPWPFPIP